MQNRQHIQEPGKIDAVHTRKHREQLQARLHSFADHATSMAITPLPQVEVTDHS